jgi:heme-degrading monooxygenase HmoA
VIFEVMPTQTRKRDYLDHAARLKIELEQTEGFVSLERFQSLSDPDKLLSLSFWRDEPTVATWRWHAGNCATQTAGRKGLFQDYRLRVAAVVRHYGLTERRQQAPADSRTVHD